MRSAKCYQRGDNRAPLPPRKQASVSTQVCSHMRLTEPQHVCGPTTLQYGYIITRVPKATGVEGCAPLRKFYRLKGSHLPVWCGTCSSSELNYWCFPHQKTRTIWILIADSQCLHLHRVTWIYLSMLFSYPCSVRKAFLILNPLSVTICLISSVMLKCKMIFSNQTITFSAVSTVSLQSCKPYTSDKELHPQIVWTPPCQELQKNQWGNRETKKAKRQREAVEAQQKGLSTTNKVVDRHEDRWVSDDLKL